MCLPRLAFLLRGDDYWNALRAYDANTKTFKDEPCPAGTAPYRFGVINTGGYANFTWNFNP